MTTIEAGDFWVANITFTNGVGNKKRPVLVLWTDGEDVIVAVVTSAKPRTITDVSLQRWEESGLKVPSTVRLSRLDSLEQSLLIAKERSHLNRPQHLNSTTPPQITSPPC